MAYKCKDTGKQISWPRLTRSDDDEPVLCSSPVLPDRSKCISWADWICSNICSDVPIELYGFPYAGTRLKNYQVTRFDSVLIYSISAGAGNETIILAKRCSVTPLKCLCFVLYGYSKMPLIHAANVAASFVVQHALLSSLTSTKQCFSAYR
jgi:hypothetical protein